MGLRTTQTRNLFSFILFVFLCCKIKVFPLPCRYLFIWSNVLFVQSTALKQTKWIFLIIFASYFKTRIMENGPQRITFEFMRDLFNTNSNTDSKAYVSKNISMLMEMNN